MAPKKPNRPGSRRGDDSNSAFDAAQPARTFGSAPEGEIPILKKKEKERRGAGVPGYVSSSGSGGGFSGAMGAGGVRVGSSLVAQPGFLGSGRIAAAVSRFMGGKTSTLGSLFASKAGAPIVLAGMLTWGGLMGAAALKVAGGKFAGTGSSSATSSAFLGTPGSGMIIDKPKDRSLGYLAQANEGEILWDKENPNAPKPEEQDAPAPAPEPEAVPQPEIPTFEMPDVSALEQKLDRDKFVKKMTNDVSSLHGGGGLKQGTAGFNVKKTLGGTSFKGRKMTNSSAKRMARVKNKLRSRSMSTRRGNSSRAIGQLKLSRNMSATGAQTAKDTGARQYSTDAFTQGRAIGGDLASIDSGGVVVPPGGGAGLTTGTSDPTPPAVGPSSNATPYQSNVDAAKQMGNNSAMMKMLGMMMIAMGVGLIASGTVLKSNHTTFPIGVALVAAGMGMVAMGVMMLQQSASMAGMAKDQADVIEDGYGQDDQAGVVDECADQANQNGTESENCNPSMQPQDFDGQLQNTIQEDVAAERNVTYGGLGDSGTVGIEDKPPGSGLNGSNVESTSETPPSTYSTQ
jgi:hypothetical protein